MLLYDPARRIDAIDALKHPYFDNFDKEQLQGTAILRESFSKQMSQISQHMEEYRRKYVNQTIGHERAVLGSKNV